MHGLSPAYLMSFVTLPNVLVSTGAIFYVVSMSMKTVIPLRITSSCERFVFIGFIDTGALAPSDTSICALAASAFDPSLPDVRVDQESSGCGGGRPVYELAQTLHEKAKAPCW